MICLFLCGSGSSFLGYKISLEKLVNDKEAAYWFVRSLFFQLLSLSETHFTFVKYPV